MVNVRKMITEITLKEGKKISISRAQVGEVVKLTLQELAKLPPKDIYNTLEAYKGRRKR